jgi:hypothetical protein
MFSFFGKMCFFIVMSFIINFVTELNCARPGKKGLSHSHSTKRPDRINSVGLRKLLDKVIQELQKNVVVSENSIRELELFQNHRNGFLRSRCNNCFGLHDVLENYFKVFVMLISINYSSYDVDEDFALEIIKNLVLAIESEIGGNSGPFWLSWGQVFERIVEEDIAGENSRISEYLLFKLRLLGLRLDSPLGATKDEDDSPERVEIAKSAIDNCPRLLKPSFGAISSRRRNKKGGVIGLLQGVFLQFQKGLSVFFLQNQQKCY